MDRRAFLKLGALGAGTVAVGSRTVLPGSAAGAGPFAHGVASGDPLADAVIIWTRVTPPGATPGSGVGPRVDVGWEVAGDPGFGTVVRRGRFSTGPDRDHTVKVDVGGLQPGSEYFYRFTADGATSPVGRMRTAPAPGPAAESVRFGMVSCSNWTGGYFSAYRHLAARNDLDFVLHLGDYLYEYGNGSDLYGPGPAIGRLHDPAHEMVLLSDYRRRHALYKTDPDLQSLHQRYAFVVTWDDHEVTNNTWKDGAENHDPDAEGDFLKRRAAAFQAYDEWMPIRLPSGRRAAEMQIYRSLPFGSLVDLTMLDLRQYRDAETSALDGGKNDDPERTLLGAPQMDFLKKQLSESTARWRLIGNSVQIMPIRAPSLPNDLGRAYALMMGNSPLQTGGNGIFTDTWNGFTANYLELLGHIGSGPVDNVVFLTGDIHSSWASDLPVDPGTYPVVSPSVATEFVCTSVTSDNLDEITGSPARTTSIAVEEAVKVANRHIKLVEFDSHGYSVVDVDDERLQCDWHFISDRTDPKATSAYAFSYKTVSGTNAVGPADGPVGARR